MAARGVDHERLNEAVGHAQDRDASLAIDRQIEALENGGRGDQSATDHDQDEPKPRREHDAGGRGWDDDLSPGR